MVKYVAIDNWLFQVMEVVSSDKKHYWLRLAGCYGVRKFRRNGKDGRLYSRKPRWW